MQGKSAAGVALFAERDFTPDIAFGFHFPVFGCLAMASRGLTSGSDLVRAVLAFTRWYAPADTYSTPSDATRKLGHYLTSGVPEVRANDSYTACFQQLGMNLTD